MKRDLQQRLTRLEELILEERDCARSLKVDRLKQLQDEKGVLVKELHDETESCPSELKSMLKRIQRENIRNARLMHSCLGNLRKMMQHCSKQLAPICYGRLGNCVQAATPGVLLIGRA